MSISAQRIALVLVVLLAANTAFVTYQHLDDFLTPYIPNDTYLRIIEAGRLFEENQLDVPVVLFNGEQAIRFGWLMRTYIGVELGEHFAYYGEFDKLQGFVVSSIDYEDQTERALSEVWFNEMQGKFRTIWPHSSSITNVEELKSHSILIVSPDLYDGNLPYSLKPFHMGQGIYIIPPNTISETNKTLYGPYVTLLMNASSSEIRSEYLNIDPKDPSIVYVMVKAPPGFESYEVTNFPSNWVFYSIDQGGDVSFPEENPTRPDGYPATYGNDPAENSSAWMPVAINGTVSSDVGTKKEGISSLRVSGAFDSSSNLGAIYDSLGTWNLSQFTSLAVWAKSSGPTTFSITLLDIYGNSRTYWSVAASDGTSVSTEWKRFVIRLGEFSSEGGAFDMGMVDKIFLYTWSHMGQGESTTLWVDDLTLDNIGGFSTYVRKARVLTIEEVIFYFKEED